MGGCLSVYRLGSLCVLTIAAPSIPSFYFNHNTTDLISVGNKVDALKLLHDVITAKR